MAIGGYRFLLAENENTVSGDYLYLHPNNVAPSQTVNRITSSKTFSWTYGLDGGTLTTSPFLWNGPAQDANPTPITLSFSTTTPITYNNAKYQYLCVLQYHETDSNKRVTDGTNFSTVSVPYDSLGAWYFFTKIYKKYDAYKTINFDANGGSVSPSSATGWGGGSITLPTPTWNAAHTFKGWYLNGTRVGGGGDTYTIPVGTESSITLTALWIESYSGNITWTGTQSHVIGTYTYTNDGGNLSLSWNITQTQVTDNGRVYYFNTIRIRYIPSSQSTAIIWQSNQTSGTFDNSSITQGISVLYYPPTCTMYYFGDSLLYSGLSSGGGKLIYNRSNGRLCYGPKLIL